MTWWNPELKAEGSVAKTAAGTGLLLLPGGRGVERVAADAVESLAKTLILVEPSVAAVVVKPEEEDQQQADHKEEREKPRNGKCDHRAVGAPNLPGLRVFLLLCLGFGSGRFRGGRLG